MNGRNPQPRRVTIMDVARAAGVSHQTVSRYLRADPGMREEIRRRIGTAVEELGYHPNLVARSMRTRRSGRLGIVLPPGDTPSMISLLGGATATAHEAGYAVEVVLVDGTPQARAGRLAELAGSGQFEGVLALTPLPHFAPAPGAAPVIVSADYDERRRSIGVLADGSLVGTMIERLARLGHRRFLHVAGPAGHPSAQGRRQAYLAAIERSGLHSHGVVDGDWSGESGMRAGAALPDGCGVTAVIAASDIVAAGVIRGAWDRGWRVPADLSVTGWDDNPLGRFLPPTLTTVATDHDRRGRRAMAELVCTVRGEPAPPDDSTPLSRVLWRESTGPAPRTP